MNTAGFKCQMGFSCKNVLMKSNKDGYLSKKKKKSLHAWKKEYPIPTTESVTPLNKNIRKKN